jgi:hypothetical protein
MEHVPMRIGSQWKLIRIKSIRHSTSHHTIQVLDWHRHIKPLQDLGCRAGRTDMGMTPFDTIHISFRCEDVETYSHRHLSRAQNFSYSFTQSLSLLSGFSSLFAIANCVTLPRLLFDRVNIRLQSCLFLYFLLHQLNSTKR